MIGFVFKVYLLHIQNDRKRKETFKEVYLRYDLLWRRFECRVILRAIQYVTNKSGEGADILLHTYIHGRSSLHHILSLTNEKNEKTRGEEEEERPIRICS